MQGEQMSKRYVREVAGQLPVRMRSDVSMELRSLLHEDLHAKAQATGRQPDGALAREVVMAFGHPHEIAARYRPKPALIDAHDTRKFMVAVLVGILILIAASIPSQILHPGQPQDVGGEVLKWMALVFLFFG